MTSLEKISHAIDSAQDLFHRHRWSCLMREDEASTKARGVFVELEEITTLLRLACRSLTSYEALLKESDEQLLHDKQDPQLLRACEQTSREMLVLTKTIYEWLYHLQQSFKQIPALHILAKEIEPYCLVRQHLIGHHAVLTKWTGAYQTSYSRLGTALTSVRQSLLEGSPEAWSEWNKLIAEIPEDHLSTDGKVDHQRGFMELWSSWMRLPREVRVRLAKFMTRYGAPLLSLEEIATLVLKLVERSLPQLTTAQRGQSLPQHVR